MLQSPLFIEFSQQLGLPIDVAYRIARTAPLRYKVYKIKKRNGSDRIVAQPAREVKAFQYLLINRLESSLPIHEAATAYRKGASILNNARVHASSAYLLKMDFSDFFPSITESDLISHLKRHCAQWLNDADINFICHIALWSRQRLPPRRLCIGAPTSPFLSNSIMYEFDELISHKAKILGVNYTRYADDLTFSCNSGQILQDIYQIVCNTVNALEYPKLTINEKKTVHASKAGLRRVTGLILTPEGKVSVGREEKRLVRAMYHRFLNGKLEDAEIEKMNGHLSYIDSIEPGFSNRLFKKNTK